MKEKTKPRFGRNLIISYAIGCGVLVIMGVLLVWRYDWVFYDWATYLSDIFSLGGVCYIIAYVLCLLSRTTVFARFGYRAQKRQAKRHKTMPKYRTIQAYLDARPEPTFDVRLFWIPGVTYFVIAVIFLIFVYLI